MVKYAESMVKENRNEDRTPYNVFKYITVVHLLGMFLQQVEQRFLGVKILGQTTI